MLSAPYIKKLAREGMLSCVVSNLVSEATVQIALKEIKDQRPLNGATLCVLQEVKGKLSRDQAAP